MHKAAVFATAALALAASAITGYRVGTGHWPHVRATSAAAPVQDAAPPVRKILYYRNPMGQPDTSPVPKKDSMGMDYIPVYADETKGGEDSFKVSLDRVQRSGVRTEKATMRKVSRIVRAPGIAKPDERTLRVISLRADGFIEKLYVNETGAHIKAGEPLFRVYSPQVVSAQVDFRTNLTSGGRPGDEASAVRRLKNLDVPDAVIDELQKGKGPIMSFDWPSPVSGYVMEKNAVEGQMAKAGDPLMRIAALDPVWIIADIAEQDVDLVKVGAAARVRFHALPDKVFSGQVTFILHELDPRTRTAKVRIEVANPGHAIRHEMFASVDIEAAGGDSDRLAVPDSAIIDTGRSQIVLVSRGEGRFEPRDVKTGVRGDGAIEILEGVKEGEDVVVAANFLIDAESNIRSALKAFTADSGPAGGNAGDAPAGGNAGDAPANKGADKSVSAPEPDKTPPPQQQHDHHEHHHDGAKP